MLGMARTFSLVKFAGMHLDQLAGQKMSNVIARRDKTRLFFHTHPKRPLFSNSTVTYIFLFQIDEAIIFVRKLVMKGGI